MKDKNRGILCIILSSCSFALMAMFLKMAGDLPSIEKSFFRNLVASVIAFVMLIRSKEKIDVYKRQDDAEYMEFELFMSRREYKMISKRMMRGKLQAVVEGNYRGSYRPYGYDILKTKTGRTLVPNQEEAPIVKNIFEWTVKEHLTPGKICKRLNTCLLYTSRCV